MHTARATRTALWIAVVLTLVCIPLVVGGLWVAARNQAGKGRADCEPEDEWSPWSECSTPCVFGSSSSSSSSSASASAAGTQFRTRAVKTLPRNGGAACAASDLLQSQSCNGSVPCGQACVPDPNADAYAWSGCPACKPDGGDALQWRLVPPLIEAGPYGRPCALSDVFQTSICTDVTTPCPPQQNCSLSDVLFSSPCNVSCGNGTRVQYRTVARPASGGGLGCDWGELVQQVPCVGPLGPTCDADPGCDAAKAPTAWGAWSACDATCGPGTQWATRPPLNADDRCPLLASQSCVGYDAACTPLPGAPGGVCAPPSELELETACYLLCAGAALPPQTDPAVCSVTANMLARACGKYSSLGSGCVQPQNCQMGPWSAWGPCSVGGCDETAPAGGVQVATRAVAVQGANGGRPCTDPEFFPWIERPCFNVDAVPYNSLSADGRSTVPAVLPPTCVPQDCVLSDWQEAGPCDVPCGAGWQPLYRAIATPASGGGACSRNPADFYASQSCDAGPCTSCTWETWDAYFGTCNALAGSCWSACSAPCDGLKTATRAIATPAGPGGTCNLEDAFTTAPCCMSCDCSDSPCPLGNGGIPCSGEGTCNTDGTCACNPGFGGPECGVRCPEGPTGQVCNGAGTCNANGVCDCKPGFSGASCEGSGSCLVYQRWVFNVPGDNTVWGQGFHQIMQPMGCYNFTSQFTEDHCNLLQLLASPPGAQSDPFSASGQPFDLSGVVMNSTCDVFTNPDNPDNPNENVAGNCLDASAVGIFFPQSYCLSANYPPPPPPYPPQESCNNTYGLASLDQLSLTQQLNELAATRWPSGSSGGAFFPTPIFSADPAVYYPGVACQNLYDSSQAPMCANAACTKGLY